MIFILFLNFSSVQAADDVQDNISTQNPISEKTFESIQNAINNSSNYGTVLLEGTYDGSGKEIVIDKPLTIKGTNKGAKLDAKSKSRIFHIQSDNVIFENMVFVNGYDYENGGAIYNEGNNIKINNCNFTNNNVDLYGAGILSDGDNVSITNCRFTKNTAKYTGGAFQVNGNNNYADNCIFTYNTGGHVGGSVAWVGDNGILSNCIFEKSGSNLKTASQFGGAVAWMGANGTLTHSSFYENNAKKSGAAIYWRGECGKLNYCIFANNTSNNDSAFCGNPNYANYNYWGFNNNGCDEFIQNKFVYYNNSFKAPENWVNVRWGSDMVEFILNSGKLDSNLPDFQFTSQITLHNNRYIFKKSTIIICQNINLYFDNAKTVKVTLKDENNVIIASKKLQMLLNGNKYEIITDKNGVAKMSVKLKKPDTYNLKVIFGGDDYYNPVSKMVNVTVKKQKPKLTVKKSKSVIKVLFRNQFGKTVSKQKIKLKINKKTIIKKTNKKGKVSFKIKLKNKRKYSVKVIFKSTTYYTGISKKVTVKR